MDVSLSELLAIGILVAGIMKAAWDFFLSSKLWEQDEAQIDQNASQDQKLRAKIDAAKQKRSRDSRANQLTFAVTTALSAWLIAIGVSSKDVSSDEIDAIQAKIQSLSDEISEFAQPAPNKETHTKQE